MGVPQSRKGNVGGPFSHSCERHRGRSRASGGARRPSWRLGDASAVGIWWRHASSRVRRLPRRPHHRCRLRRPAVLQRSRPASRVVCPRAPRLGRPAARPFACPPSPLGGTRFGRRLASPGPGSGSGSRRASGARSRSTHPPPSAGWRLVVACSACWRSACPLCVDAGGSSRSPWSWCSLRWPWPSSVSSDASSSEICSTAPSPSPR